MNDDFTFLIFTYHNVFHSLLASFRLRKWRLLALVSSDVYVDDVDDHNRAPLGYDQD